MALLDAIDAYTMNGAWASFDEDRKGVIARDMLADLIILSEDIFDRPADAITEAEVTTTIFDGQVVFERPIAAIR